MQLEELESVPEQISALPRQTSAEAESGGGLLQQRSPGLLPQATQPALVHLVLGAVHWVPVALTLVGQHGWPAAPQAAPHFPALHVPASGTHEAPLATQ